MVWPAVIAGGAVIGGALLNSMGGRDQNLANAQQAHDQRMMQADMSSRAHQIEVADLRAAGLNPILSSKFGGASTPNGAAIPAVNEMAGVDSAVSSAVQAYRTKAEVENMQETNQNLREQREQIKSDTALNNALRKKAVEDAKVSASTAKKVEVATELDKAAVPAAKNKEAVEKTWLGRGAAYFDRVMQSLTGGGNAAKAVSQGRDEYRGYSAQGEVKRR